MSTTNVFYNPPNNQLPITPFYFDKYYIISNEEQGQAEYTEFNQKFPNELAKNDGVQIGRYIFVNYSSDLFEADKMHKYTVYQKIIDINNSEVTYIPIAKLNSILTEGQMYWNTNPPQDSETDFELSWQNF